MLNRNEHVCHYLSEASKANAEKRFKGRTDEEIYMIAVEALPEMEQHSVPLKKRLERSAKTASRIPTEQLELNFEEGQHNEA
jgi:hypothetical protein